ncbi:MAG: T9SS type A sorting domain-containing protein [Ferruginibacter sp.]
MKKIYLLLFSVIVSVGSFAQFVPVTVNLTTSQNIVVGGSNYHASENIYLADEIGPNNYITAASAIQQIFFFQEVAPVPATINNYKISMKNIPAATTTLATGTYSAVGYTVVFNGTMDASVGQIVPIILSTPFQRTAGSNLQILIERTDNVVHTTGPGIDEIWDASQGNSNSFSANSARRYNGTVALSAATSLTASVYRPAIAFNHTFAVDAIANDIIFPAMSCYNGPVSVAVEVLNGGTLPIAAGAVSTTLHVRGVNTFTGTQTNTGIIAPGASEFVIFSGVNLSNAGNNFDTAYVHLAGDGSTYYDTVSTITTKAPTFSAYPQVETVEEFFPVTAASNLNVFPYVENLASVDAGGDWTLGTGIYGNANMPDLAPLGAPTDSAYYFFDSYVNENIGTESRLYSNCFDLTTATGALLTYYTNHDSSYSNPGDVNYSPDSLYVSVSTDRGATWTRIYGTMRPVLGLNNSIWQLESVNLNAYIGQVIQIGFEAVSKWGNVIMLDNITVAATLPVSLVNFNAQRNGKVNDLSWKTSMEQNTSRFIIERSTNGGNTYTDIGQVAAAGNSNTERSYHFTDISPAKGYNYYRLRMIDINNSFKFSDIKNVRNEGAADFSFAPNPVQQQMKIKLDADKADKGFITITDMSGKQVYSNSITVAEGSNNLVIETGKFSSGLYIITIQLSNDKIVQKFNKF